MVNKLQLLSALSLGTTFWQLNLAMDRPQNERRVSDCQVWLEGSTWRILSMVQTAPNTLRNSIQAGFWGPFTASQRVFRVLGSFLFLRSSDPATLLACFLDRSELQAEWFGCAQNETLAPKRGEKRRDLERENALRRASLVFWQMECLHFSFFKIFPALKWSVHF